MVTCKLEGFGTAHTGDISPVLKSLVPLNFELTNSLQWFYTVSNRIVISDRRTERQRDQHTDRETGKQTRDSPRAGHQAN